MTPDSSMAEILDIWFESKMDQVHTMIPAVVETYDAGTRLAKVKPAIDMKLSTGEVAAMPAIADVPVVFPSSSQFELTWPLVKGDVVMLVVCEASMGNFLNGNSQVVAEDSSRFTLTDAVAIPGMFRTNSIPAPARSIHVDPATDSITVVSAGGARLAVSGTLLDMANQVSSMKAELEKLWDAIIQARTDAQSWMATLAATGGAPVVGSAFTAPAAVEAAAILTNTVSKTQVAQLLKG